MRSRFWKSFGLVAAVVVTTVLLLLYTQTLKELTPRYSVRAIAATIMLTATLARGGWDIQSWKGKTTNERIDRAMFILSQVGATGILLLALAL